MIKIEILLKNDFGIFDITKNTLEDIRLTMYYKELPSNLNIKILNKNLNICEGDSLSLKINDEKVFFGYIFNIKIDEEGIFSIRAYDQIRYLIARDTYIYKNKSASQVFSMICDDFGIKKGTIEDTIYKIPYRIEENQRILDIIYEAMEITKKNTGNRYIIFDDFGKLCLKKYDDMKENLEENQRILDIIYEAMEITKKNTGNRYIILDDFGKLCLKKYDDMKENLIIDLAKDVFKYEIEKSIDKDVYNSIKVSVKNRKNKIISTYLKEDSKNKEKWGNLRYFERLPNTFTKAQAENYAQNILNIKNRNKFKINLETMGDYKIRAGSILTILNGKERKQMIAEKCQHIIENNLHKMKLDLIEI